MSGFEIENGVLTAYSGKDETVIIPDGVTKIGRAAFKRCKEITGITFPEGLLTVGEFAFSECSSLKAIALPDSVQHIHYNAFEDCDSLESVSLGTNVKLISRRAFENCAKLQTLVVAGGVPRIADEAFTRCESLYMITASEETVQQVWNSLSDADKTAFCFNRLSRHLALQEHEKQYSLLYIDEIVGCAIAADAPQALEAAFALWTKMPLNGVDKWIADSEDALAVRAFLMDYKHKTYRQAELRAHGKRETEKALGLRRRTQADWRLRFSFEPIKGGLAITGIKTTDAVAEIPSSIGGKSVKRIDPYAFRRCRTLVSVVIPGSVNRVCDGAFSECTNLTSVTFLRGKTLSIASQAFKGCERLTELTFSEGLTDIGAEAFYQCRHLTEVTFPESIRTIKRCAFLQCTALCHIRFCGRVPTLANGAFADTAWLAAQPPLAVIGNTLVRYKGQETQPILPASLSVIAENAFHSCDSIESIVIPEGVTAIEPCTFVRCRNLKSVTFPKTLQSIGQYAFSDCVSLESVVIPEGVRSIGEGAFSGCSQLFRITLPESLTYVDGSFFEIGGMPFADDYAKALTIYGKAGSYAEEYAKDYGIAFEEIQ